MKNLDKMGVYILMAHLLITLSFIIVYAYTIVSGQEDETLRTILTVIVGYWFGAMGKDALLSRPHQTETRETTTTRTDNTK